MDKPFFSVDQKSGVELTKLAEAGNVDPLKSLVADQTGIITTLHGAIVVVYTGNTNPIYQLGQKDAQLGLAALAQRGDPAQLKASLEKSRRYARSTRLRTPSCRARAWNAPMRLRPTKKWRSQRCSVIPTTGSLQTAPNSMP